MATNVQVCCRFRPAAANEGGAKRCVKVDPKGASVSLLVDSAAALPVDEAAVAAGKAPSTAFHFDAVFDSQARQSDVFDKSAGPFVKDIFAGFNTTIFACPLMQLTLSAPAAATRCSCPFSTATHLPPPFLCLACLRRWPDRQRQDAHDAG